MLAPVGRVPGRVVVVGAGVTGLSCAVRLAEAGHRVDVLARDLPLETTSVVAAALWYPYKALPQDRVTAWSASVVRRVRGARRRDGHRRPDAAGHRGAPRADRRPLVGGRGARPARIAPPPGYADAWSFTAPVIDMPVYLRWLRARLDELGGTLTRMSLRAALPADRRRGGQLRRASARAGWPATTTCGRCAARSCSSSGVDLDRWWLDADRTDVRRPARATRSWSAAPTRTATGAGPRRRRPRPRSSTGRPGWCPSSPAPRSSATGWGCGRCARGAAGGRGPGRPLLRPGRRRRDAQLGLCDEVRAGRELLGLSARSDRRRDVPSSSSGAMRQLTAVDVRACPAVGASGVST